MSFQDPDADTDPYGAGESAGGTDAGANVSATGPATAGDTDGGGSVSTQEQDQRDPTRGRDESYGRTSERDRGIDAYATVVEALDNDVSALTSNIANVETDTQVDSFTSQFATPVTEKDAPFYGKFDPKDPRRSSYDKEAVDWYDIIAKEEKSTEAKRAGLHTSAAALRTAKSFLGPLGAFFGPVPTRDEIDAMTPKEVNKAVDDINAKQQEQEAEQEGLSTGEDDRKVMQDRVTIKKFRDEYEWAEGLSDDVVLAYAKDPTLLQLKLDNVRMLDTIEAGQAKPALTSGVSPRQVIYNPMSVYA